FLFIQGYEFYEYLVHQSFSWQTSAFGSAFYSLVGFHGLHVIFGVFWLFGLWTQSFFWKEVTPEDLSRGWVAGLYWHFVDVVWVVIFTVVYLSGVVG
ncbi:MAG: cytochrome c oxidase subunit 3, partial [Bacillota bacterium]|nr:cytochrome c oxidase subunit 3 [Bacillota bacterium]